MILAILPSQYKIHEFLHMTQSIIVTLGWRQERVKASGRWTPTFQRQRHCVKLCWLMKLLELLLQVRTSPTTSQSSTQIRMESSEGNAGRHWKTSLFLPLPTGYLSIWWIVKPDRDLIILLVVTKHNSLWFHLSWHSPRGWVSVESMILLGSSASCFG
jgi:hypothetical protein